MERSENRQAILQPVISGFSIEGPVLDTLLDGRMMNSLKGNGRFILNNCDTTGLTG